MIRVGLDIGSRAAKMVARGEDGQISVHELAPTGISPEQTCRSLLEPWHPAQIRLAVTGYGRKLLGAALRAERVETEIAALGRAAVHLHPAARSAVDIGGHDTKVLNLDETGRVKRFRLNDRCASGSGRFIEMMAAAVGLSIEEFAALAKKASRSESLSSMCAVFAESELVTKLAAGSAPDCLALGVHEAVADRIAALIHASGAEDPVLLTGGGALNSCLVNSLRIRTAAELVVPDHPAFACALGAVLGLN